MDIVFVLGAIALWGVSALMVRGFERLEQPSGERS